MNLDIRQNSTIISKENPEKGKYPVFTQEQLDACNHMLVEARRAVFFAHQKQNECTAEQDLDLARKEEETKKQEYLKIKHLYAVHHMNWVEKMAYSYMYKTMGRVEVKDLIQEGYLGLLEALEKYDPEKAEFRTYASFWVIKFFRNLISANRTIKITPSSISHYIKYRKLLKEKGSATEADQNEAAKKTGQSLVALKAMETKIRLTNVMALDTPNGFNNSPANDAIPLLESIQDPQFSPEEFCIREESAQEVRAIVDQLDPRERFIVESRELSDPPIEYKVLQGKLHIGHKYIAKIHEGIMAKLKRKLAFREISQESQGAIGR